MQTGNSESDPYAWVQHFLPLAESGDVDAQLAVGWEYFRGGNLPRDLKLSESWFRRAANQGAGEKAIFQLIKMLIITKNPRLEDVYKENSWNLGAIDLIYALYKRRQGMPEEDILPLFEKAAFKGNLYAALQCHIARNRGWRRVLGVTAEIQLCWRILQAGIANRNDERLLYR